MDALDDHFDRSRAATPQDRLALLELFTGQCDPLDPSELRPIRGGRVPDAEWPRSAEYAALARMLGRCWPSELCQNQ